MRLPHLLALPVAAVLALPASPAGAQDDVCFSLEARLVQLEQSRGPSANARSYDASIAQQRNEIDRAMAEARRAGCVGGFLIFRRQAEAKCPQLMAAVDRMRANLSRLMRGRGQAGGDPFAAARERNEILRSLAMNGCGGTYAGGAFPEMGGLLQSLFGQARFSFPGRGGFLDGVGFGTYRTLCVRTCDGYYFPISFATLPGKFSADAAACQQMCPGTEAALYVHRNPGEDTEAMVSLDGQAYTALPTAFRYRQQYDVACTCRSSTPLAGLADLSIPLPLGADGATELPGGLAAVPVPRLRIGATGEDPETIANRSGKLDPAAAPSPTPDVAAGVAPDGRKIRIVGPADFYAAR
jgi:hypothetical protein